MTKIFLILFGLILLASSFRLKSHKKSSSSELQNCDYTRKFNLITRGTGKYLYINNDENRSLVLRFLDLDPNVVPGSNVWVNCDRTIKNVATGEHLELIGGRFVARNGDIQEAAIYYDTEYVFKYTVIRIYNSKCWGSCVITYYGDNLSMAPIGRPDPQDQTTTWNVHYI